MGAIRATGRLGRAAALAALLAGVVATVAAAHGTSGNPTAGKSVFVSTCGVCHKLAAAKSPGTIGPDLDKVKLSQATIVKAIEKGGASVMSKSAVATYPTHMTAYQGVLSTTQIEDVAAFVYTSTHTSAKAKPKPKLTLTAAGHRPKTGARWAYTAHATLGGKAATAKITAQVVDPTGHAHAVLRGATTKKVAGIRFRGRFTSFVVWPKSARKVPLKFRVTIVSGKTKKVVTYKVTPR
jgi:mono/diheme cytochrome c family protein